MIVADYGHGIGTFCFQAAFTKGCEARGIEVVANRQLVADQIQSTLMEEHKIITESGKVCTIDTHMDTLNCLQAYSICGWLVLQEHAIGPIRLVYGRLEDPNHRPFLTHDVDFAFCNNYGDVFGARSMPAGQSVGHTLNDYVAGHLTQMKPGAMLLTLAELPVGPGREAANKRRLEKGMDSSPIATFFDVKEFPFTDIPENRNLLSWRRCNKSFSLFLYTRNQSKDATFLCSNLNCENAKKNVPIPAWKRLEDDKIVSNSTCPCCDITARTSRLRSAPERFSF